MNMSKKENEQMPELKPAGSQNTSLRVALAGNPNCGKTTLFNILTGSNQYVGNWPGVTVEKKEGKYKEDTSISIIDLPGIYSLSPYTPEEVVARKFLAVERPEVILNIVDGTNIERNLYLTTQLMELGLPVVVAINMMDIVRKNGDKIDTENLSQKLGVPVIEISALKSLGITEAMDAAIDLAKHGEISVPLHCFSGVTEHALAHIEEAVLHDIAEEQQRWYAIKLFERDEKVGEFLNLPLEKRDHIEYDILSCEKELDDDSESIITNERYEYISKVVKLCCKKRSLTSISTSEKIDSVLTNRFLAIPIFVGIMFLIYYVSMSTIGAFLTDFTNDIIFGKWITTLLLTILTAVDCAQWLQSLIIDGIVAGVGGVLSFVPQLLLLFLMLAFLEASGYMSRIAFIMDKIFRKFGLSGKSFIPLLVGTGCSVPGIMASRTIENDKDRRMTIITTSFIPCGAKLPVIALIAGALFDKAWWVAPSAYFVGIIAVIISGLILKKTRLFAGDPSPFVMELPAYHMPTLKNVLLAMWDRGWGFIKKAGTIILLSSILIWFLSNFGFTETGFGIVEDMDKGLLADIGNLFAWIFIPLGFGNWEATVATIIGLTAKENIVNTFGILYGFAEVAGDGTEYWNLFASSFSPLSAYAFLVFNLLCAPCFAAVAAISKEMNSAKWTFVAIFYQTIFAYAISLCLYQFGMFFMTGIFSISTACACIILLILLWLILRPEKKISK